MRVGVVGYSGYIGNLICQTISASGHDLIRIEHSHYLDTDLILDIVFDCSFPKKYRNHKIINQYFNYLKQRVKHFQNFDVPYIYMGSHSSKSISISNYGRSKLFAEQIVFRNGGIILRLGLVKSLSNPGGRFEELQTLLQKLPIVPVLHHDWAPVIITHADEVCQAALRILANPQIIEKEVTPISYEVSFSEIQLQLIMRKKAVHLTSQTTAILLGFVRFFPIGKLDNLKSIAHKIR